MKPIRVAAFVALLLSAASAAQASPQPRLDSSARAIAYLQAAGVDVSHVLVQRGTNNYVGNACPGAGWTCASDDGRPVVQITERGSNTYTCSGSVTDGGTTCTVVQTSTIGNNNAQCTLASDITPVAQTCSISQQSTSGANSATVKETIDQNTGQTQAGSQRSTIYQRSSTGANTYNVTQKISQSTDSAPIGPVVQKQTASSSSSSDQRSSTGSNGATLSQSLALRENSTGGSSVDQRQNDASNAPDLQFSHYQQSDGGTNSTTVAQAIDEQAVANQSPAATTQIEGSRNGGIRGALTQSSPATSQASIQQTERQHEVANHGATQVEIGPHICCDIAPPTSPVTTAPVQSSTRTSAGTSQASTGSPAVNQSSNPADAYQLTGSTTQDTSTGTTTRDYAQGYFSTSGHGTTTETATQNGTTNSTSCQDTCATTQTCVDGACDSTPPDTTIDSGPASPTSSRSATFGFHASEAATFACSLDGGAATSCSSPATYSGLSDGSHTFSVVATDSAGNIDPTPATWAWTVDGTAPDTFIDSGPSGLVASRSASFAFHASEAATFACSLDGGAATSCSSPATYSGLSDGSHTFSVVATDTTGNVDPTPASRSWTVDATAPDTFIDSGPSGATQSRTATFAFHSSEPATFVCSLDGGSQTICSSPVTYSGLADAVHTFTVTAVDSAANMDPTPASRTWTVDATKPQSDFDPGQDGAAYVPGRPLTSPQVTGTATDNVSGVASLTVYFSDSFGNQTTRAATLTCNAARTSCTWTVSIPTTPGSYTATKSATDAAGNIEPKDESISFTVVP